MKCRRVRQVADIVGATWPGDPEASQACITGIAATTAEATKDVDEHEAQAIEKLRVAPC